jgi:teichuronic acid biosynthesis glycosyltransferase TuaG
MPAYNAEPFIEEAIASVIAQTVADWELIVIDDCSTDDTVQIVSAFVRQDPRIQLLTNASNMGVAKTRNRGLDLCRGQYVALLDSDDYWKPRFLEKMLERAEQTGADIIYCSYELVDEQGKKVCNDFIVPPETTFEESIVRSVILPSASLITSDVATESRFPTNMYHEDIALWFQILRDGGKACGVTDVLAAYRQREGSRSAGKLKSACRRWTIYRKHLGMPLGKSIVTMVRYGILGIKKYRRV